METEAARGARSTYYLGSRAWAMLDLLTMPGASPERIETRIVGTGDSVETRRRLEDFPRLRLEPAQNINESGLPRESTTVPCSTGQGALDNLRHSCGSCGMVLTQNAGPTIFSQTLPRSLGEPGNFSVVCYGVLFQSFTQKKCRCRRYKLKTWAETCGNLHANTFARSGTSRPGSPLPIPSPHPKA